MLKTSEETAMLPIGTVTVRGSANNLTQEIVAGRHKLVADEPVSDGGKDLGPGPFQLLMAALGACTSMTVLLFAGRKSWPLDDVTVRLRHVKTQLPDGGATDFIEREIVLNGPLSDEQRARLLDVANKCPVHRTLTSGVKIETKLSQSLENDAVSEQR